MRDRYDEQLDALLAKAFKEQYKNELNNGPSDEELEAIYPFTDKQLSRAHELSRINKKSNSFWKRGLGKVAAVLICVAASAGVIAVANPDVIGKVGSQVADWVDEYIAFDFTDAEADYRIDISKACVNYIPEGFTLDTDSSDDISLSHVYINEAGDVIIIDIRQSYDINLMTENQSHEVKSCYINGYEGYISYSEDVGQGSVYFGSSYFTVAVSGMIEKDELIKIAENIRFKD